MEFPIIRRLALFVVVLLTGAACAGAPAANVPAAVPQPATEQTTSPDKGLLWKVEKAGRPPSFLFGTIHSDDPRVMELPAPVQTVFDASASFTMEMISDAEAMNRLAEAMRLKPGEDLRSLLGAELYRKTEQALKARGLPAEGLRRTKPWVVVVTLNTPRRETGNFLDLKLYMRAKAQQKPVYGLETVAEQIAVFDTLPLDKQIALLRESLTTPAEFDAALEELVQAYLDRDLAALQRISEASEAASTSGAYRALMDKLLLQRNHRMVQRMEPRLREGNAFIAIGALHLPGEEGVLALLAQQGYTVSAVY